MKPPAQPSLFGDTPITIREALARISNCGWQQVVSPTNGVYTFRKDCVETACTEWELAGWAAELENQRQ